MPTSRRKSLILGRPARGGFHPLSVSGLTLWLEGSRQNSLYDANTGGSVVASGGTVGRWEDLSGNARHFTQGTGGDRPTWNSAGYVEFSGGTPSGTHLLSGVAISNFLSLRDSTIFLVVTALTGIGAPTDILSTDSTHSFRYTAANTITFGLTDSGFRTVAQTGITLNTPFILCARRYNNGEDLAISANGGTETTASTPTGNLTSTSLTLGMPPAARNKAKCRIHAVRIWNTDIGLAARNACGADLATLYAGTAWTLQT